MVDLPRELAAILLLVIPSHSRLKRLETGNGKIYDVI